MLIGLTGGIGSGKSLAGDFFKSKNIDVIDADDLAHNALDIEGEGYKKFLDIFGETFLDENSEICLLYTSDAADDSLRVDLGGRRIIKKITNHGSHSVFFGDVVEVIKNGNTKPLLYGKGKYLDI